MACTAFTGARVGVKPTFAGASLVARKPIAVQGPRTLVIENAHKKGAGSTKNGRDSNSKSRGVKVYGGQPVTQGGIIVRQVGNTSIQWDLKQPYDMQFHAGNNVGTGKDFTIYSLQQGIVVYETIKRRKCISVYPEGHEKTAGLQLQRKPDGRKAKRLEAWKGTPRNRD